MCLPPSTRAWSTSAAASKGKCHARGTRSGRGAQVRQDYGMVLRGLVLGAATAGFRDIILIGDHGGGQDVLQQTAATLDARLTPTGARVFCCDGLKSRDEFSQYLKDHKVTGEGPAKGVDGGPRNGRAELGKGQ